MYDCFNRKINYLRISVTDRCNLRCKYCMPRSGVKRIPKADILSFDEIEAVVRHGVDLGINKVRITGGEPLVRKNIIQLIERLARIEGIQDLAMTTNGILLPQYARPLKNAGLMRVNISLDTTNPLKYQAITRTGNIKDAFAGIEAALEANLHPVKLNCVIQESKEEPDAQLVAAFGAKHNIAVRYIHEMRLDAGEFHVVEGGEGGNCSACNRLRLTAKGELKPCLFNDIGYKIRKVGIARAYELALANKPGSGQINNNNQFYNIGG